MRNLCSIILSSQHQSGDGPREIILRALGRVRGGALGTVHLVKVTVPFM